MPRANANGGKAADEDEDQGGEDVQEDDTTDARQPTLQLGAALFLKAATAMSTALVAATMDRVSLMSVCLRRGPGGGRFHEILSVDGGAASKHGASPGMCPVP
jgi:hypothetical protein